MRAIPRHPVVVGCEGWELKQRGGLLPSALEARVLCPWLFVLQSISPPANQALFHSHHSMDLILEVFFFLLLFYCFVFLFYFCNGTSVCGRRGVEARRVDTSTATCSSWGGGGLKEKSRVQEVLNILRDSVPRPGPARTNLGMFRVDFRG